MKTTSFQALTPASIGSDSIFGVSVITLGVAKGHGLLIDETTGTLFCSDLFTQSGADHAPLTEGDILEPSEALRKRLDFYTYAPNTAAMVEKVAATTPLKRVVTADECAQAIMAAVRTPAVREVIANQGGEPVGGTPDEFAAYFRAELAKWAQTVKTAKIQIE